MELKGRYKLSYTLDKELKDLTLEIELKQIEGLMKPGQNVWCGVAMLDGKPYDKSKLDYCVNAKIAVQRIGQGLRDELKENAKKLEQSFRIKKEEVI
jgi:hypothetical protein